MAANPYLLWDNRFAEGTVTASSEASGYPVGNVADWRPFDVWRANATTSPAWVKVDLGASAIGEVDTLVVSAHNLKTTGATAATLAYSDDGSSWVDVDFFNPQDYQDTLPVQLQVANAGGHRYWRLSITGTLTVAPEIGLLTAGVRLELSRGIPRSWDPYGNSVMTEWNTNRAGAPLGAILYGVEKRFSLDLGNVGYTDDEFFKRVDGPNWDDSFEAHRRSKWFWFAWAPDREPNHCWLSRIDGDTGFGFVDILTRRAGSVPLVCYVPVP